MPFNPFSSFRKYQKFWMATILLVCMVTFVLCTGVGGDLSQRLLEMFGRRSGSALAKLDGRTIYVQELQELKDQRLLAEKYTRKAFEILDRNITEVLKTPAKSGAPKEEIAERTQAGGIQKDIELRLAKKVYWDTGTKLEELVDFIMWRTLADRLEIELIDQSVIEMFNEEIFSNPPKFFGDQHAQEIFYEVRSNFRSVTWGSIIQALRDEFRVRLAKLSLAQAQVQAYRRRTEPDQIHLKFWEPVDTRAPASPYELWEFYRKNRTEYDVALVPVTAQDFLGRVAKADKKEIDAWLKDAKYGDAYKVLVQGPSKTDLEFFYKERRLKPYDPTSPENGLQTPQQVKAEYIVGDPESEYYQRPAQALAAAEMYPPAWAPNGSLIAAAVRYAAVPRAIEKGIDEKLMRDGKSYLSEDLMAKIGPKLAIYQTAIKFRDSKVPEESGLMPKLLVGWPDNPIAAAALYYGGYTLLLNRDTAMSLEQEHMSRANLAGSMLGLASLQGPPLTPELLYHVWKPTVSAKMKRDVEKHMVDRLAIASVQHNMQIARAALEKVKANPDSIKLRINTLVNDYGLTRYSTPTFHDRFSIDKAPEMAVLKEAYKKYYVEVNILEGRGGTPGELKEDQLYRLFFDAEPFSASAREYFVRPWPPDVTGRPSAARPRAEDEEVIQDRAVLERLQELRDQLAKKQQPETIRLFDHAPKPILVWKTEDIQPTYPPDVPFEKLDAALQKRVEHLYKLEKARDALALPVAREIAEELQRVAAENLPAAVRSEAAKLGHTPISLPRVSQLEKIGSPERVGYRAYKLPRDKFEYPRDDMNKNLVSLIEAKKPVETGAKELKQLDDANKALFEKNKTLGKQIQIFANKPHTTYYVATIVNAPLADRRDFVEAYKKTLGSRNYDDFVNRAHEELAKDYFNELTIQLRAQMQYEIVARDEDRKSFD